MSQLPGQATELDADGSHYIRPNALPELLKQEVRDMGQLIREQQRQYRSLARLVSRQQQLYTELETDNHQLRARFENELGITITVSEGESNADNVPSDRHASPKPDSQEWRRVTVPPPEAVPINKDWLAANKLQAPIAVAQILNGTEQPESPLANMESTDTEEERPPRPSLLRAQTPADGVFEDQAKVNHKKVLFADAEQMKQKMKAELGKPEYSVTKFYHTEGLPQKIARSSFFEQFTLLVIGINAIWLAIDTDYNPAPTLISANPVFIVVENVFCFYFMFEWIVRFLSFRRKVNCFRDFWFMFDTVLVMLMVLETWLMPLILVSSGVDGENLSGGNLLKIFRLMRLSRMGRMVRLLRAFPELVILVKGLGVATRSVTFTLFLLVMIVYVFAVVLVQMVGPHGFFSGTEVEYQFRGVPAAMNELLLTAATPDQADLVNDILDVSIVLYPIIIVFMLLAGITVMNMLVGILVEVISVVSTVEKEALMLQGVKLQLKEMMDGIGLSTEPEARINKHDFVALLNSPGAARALAEVGVDAIALVDLTDFLFMEKSAYSFASLMDVVLNLRGSNRATVKDILDLRKVMASDMKALLSREGEGDESGDHDLCSGCSPHNDRMASANADTQMETKRISPTRPRRRAI